MLRPTKNLFIAKVDEEFVCGICLDVLSEPQTCPDGHLYCKSCITEWLKTSTVCPSCRKRINTKQGLTYCRPIANLIEKGIVRCSTTLNAAGEHNNAEDEDKDGNTAPPPTKKRKKVAEVKPTCCNWTGPYSALQAHLSNDCEWGLVPCNFAGCTVSVTRVLLEEHKAACMHRITTCKACKSNMKASAADSHEEVCLQVKVDCTYSECKAKVLRKNLSAHESTCSFREEPCPYTHLGCDRALVRVSKLDEHLAEYIGTHAKLAGKALSRLSQQAVKWRLLIMSVAELQEGQALRSKRVVMGQGQYSVYLRVKPSPTNADFAVLIHASAVDEASAALLFPARIGGSTISVCSQFPTISLILPADTTINGSGGGRGYYGFIKRDDLPLLADKDGQVTIEATIQIRPPAVIDLS